MAPTFQMNSHSRTVETDIREENTILSIEEQELKNQEEQLDIVKKLRDSTDWHEVIQYSYMSTSAFKHSLTATTLRGPHKILRRPLKFFDEDRKNCILIVYLGDQLCGGDGIHNGLLATLLDEQLAYVSLPHLPNFTGFTANLNVNYCKTVYSNQWIIIRGILDKVEGRKAFANAWIENLNGVRMTEAKSLYISPRTQ